MALQPLGDTELAEALDELEGWSIESGKLHAQFVFERNGDDELRLLGYVLGSRDETVFHEMSRGSLRWGENAGRTDRDNRVVIAAAAR